METAEVDILTKVRQEIVMDQIIKIRFMVSSIYDMAQVRKQEYIMNKCKHLDLELDGLFANIKKFI